MYTGDDFNYPALIAGDEQGYSHALLGIFDAIAPAASAALAALAKGDMKSYDRLMAPTVPLSRLIFRAPTQYYKTGIVFLAWLNGHQDHFVMVNGAQAMRPLPYFTEAFRLADQARLLSRPGDGGEADEEASGRLRRVMRDLSTALNACAINTATLGFQAPIADVDRRRGAGAGFGAIAPWRREVEGQDVTTIARRIRDAGLAVTGYCRSTYIPAATRAGFDANIEANRRAIEDAAVLGAQSFVMVVGGLAPGSKDIAAARAQVAEGAALLLEHGKAHGVRIALEPLHPVYAADRSCLSLALRSPRHVRGHRTQCCGPVAGCLPRCLSRLVGPEPRARHCTGGCSKAHPRFPRLRLAGAHRGCAERPRHDG